MPTNTNTLINVIPQLLAQGLVTLRENAVMPRLVNADYSAQAANRGSSVDIPIPASISAVPVTPGYVGPDDAGITPGQVTLNLDQWKEAPFFLTDKEMMEVMDGTIPMQAAEAVKALANDVDQYLLGLYTGIYTAVGTAGTTPFATDVTVATSARKFLNNYLAPMTDRRFVFNPDVEANALGLRAFQDVAWTGDARGINEGQIVRKLGFDWHLDQNVKDHTAGTVATSFAIKTATAHAEGLTTLTTTTGGDADLKVGDILTIAGHDQQYVVTEDAERTGAGDLQVKVDPGLKAALTGAEAITIVGDHSANIAFHRDAIAFANRPLLDSAEGLGSQIMSMQDPVSGLTLRLEVSRQYKRTRWSFDILYGAKLVRPELAVRVLG
jgi:hypothetical protein